jgi:hypothetical protein
VSVMVLNRVGRTDGTALARRIAGHAKS